MKKEKYWQDIWGYVSVLENSDELIAKKPTNERILELKGCKSIRRIKIDKAKEPIDLSILSGIEKLKEIDISSSEFINMKSLSVLDHLNSAFFDRCVVDFDDVLSLRNLEQLTLRRCKVKNIPVDLALDYLEWVTISECGIEDAYFIKNRKRLISIDVENNNISDFGFLKDMKRLRFLNVSDNPVEELGSVVSCRRLERLYMKEVGGLVLTPENIRMLPSGLAVHTDNGVIKVGLDGNEDKNNNTDCMEYKERKNIEGKIISEGEGYSSSIAADKNLEMIIYDHCSSSGVVDFYRALLNHPDDKVVGWIVEYVARFSRVRAIDAFEEAASENIERINDYAIKNFQYYLKDSWWQAMDDFNIGKFNDFHFSIVSLIEKYPGPIWSDFCLLLLKERSNFSSLHYGLYNKLLRSIAKTKSHDLVFPIIDLIGYEKYVSDGGNVFVKKCLKAAGALGKKADAELLNNRFDIESEGREDVVKEYYKAIARLGRKKH